MLTSFLSHVQMESSLVFQAVVDAEASYYQVLYENRDKDDVDMCAFLASATAFCERIRSRVDADACDDDDKPAILAVYERLRAQWENNAYNQPLVEYRKRPREDDDAAAADTGRPAKRARTDTSK